MSPRPPRARGAAPAPAQRWGEVRVRVTVGVKVGVRVRVSYKDRLHLLLLVHAAVDAHALYPARLAEAHHLLVDLLRELTRRREHQGQRPVAVGEHGLRVDVHDRWQQVGERLARARLRQTDRVHPLHRDGPALSLDGRRRAEAHLEQCVEDVLRERGLHEGAHRVRTARGVAVDRDAQLRPQRLHLLGRERRHVRVLQVEVALHGGQLRRARSGGRARRAVQLGRPRRRRLGELPGHAGFAVYGSWLRCVRQLAARVVYGSAARERVARRSPTQRASLLCVI